MKRAPKTNKAVALAFLLVVFMLAITELAFKFAATKNASAHLYNDPSASIEKIDLNIFYAVPKDRQPFDYDAVKARIENLMPDFLSFHQSQFLGKSAISYKIFPQAVMLEKDAFDYDTEVTSRGNPAALRSITLELESRVFDKSGDLFSENYVKSSGGFRVIAIIYEGVGASGTESSSLLSRDFITRDEYASVASTLFYHEFGHTMGIPDGYDLVTDDPFTNDIMGSGRREPIKSNYIDQETLKAMGVL